MKKDKDFLRLQEEFESLVEDIEKGLVKNYAKGYKDLKKDLEKAYDKYSKDGVLTMDEMRKYKRLERLEKATRLAVLSLYKDNKKYIRESMKEIIKTTEDKSFKIIKAKKSISPIARSFKIDDLIDQAVAGRVWAERVDHYGSNFVYDVHTIIRRGLEDGKTYTQVSKELRDKFGKDIGNTARIVRTESARIHEHTTFKTMEEINKEVKLTKTWRTMRDGAVRSSHQVMEGQTVGIDEEFVLPSGATTLYPTGSGDPAEDINCRCYVEYNVEKEEEKGYNDNESIDFENRLVSAKTIKEANNIAKEMGFEADYSGIDVKCANEWNKGLYEAKRDFPEVADKIKFVGSSQKRYSLARKEIRDHYNKYFKDNYFESLLEEGYSKEIIDKSIKKKVNALTKDAIEMFKVKPNSMASSWSHSFEENLKSDPLHGEVYKILEKYHGISLNDKYFDNYDKVIESGLRQAKAKWHPEGCYDVKATFDHEFAHQIDAYLNVGDSKTIQKLFDKKTKEEITKGLSTYAWDNDNRNRYAEMIAEGWSEYCNNDNPREMAKTIGEEIMKLWKKKK